MVMSGYIDPDDPHEPPTEQSDGPEDGFKDQKVISLNEAVGNVRYSLVDSTSGCLVLITCPPLLACL